MIETIVKPQPLDNDIAVVKVLQLMGQLSPSDIKYVISVCSRIYEMTQVEARLSSAHWVAGEAAGSDINWESHL
jgi:uncharacterized protein affecting Mg2+/Co2+ transport